MRVLKWIFGVLIGLVVVVVLLLTVGFFFINSDSFQNRMLEKATAMLADKLDTRVEIDSVSIDLLSLDAELYGLMVEDRQQRRMLDVKQIKADLDLWRLLHHEVVINEAKVQGLHAELHHVKGDSIDSIPNYKFVLDAFKKDKKGKAAKDTTSAKSGKSKMQLVLKRFRAKDIDVAFNQYQFRLATADYRQPDDNTRKAEVGSLEAQWKRTNKKGWEVDHSLNVSRLTYNEDAGQRHVELAGITFRNDNHHPRKNDGKPKRGFFDAEHFKLHANLKAEIDYIGKDTLHAQLTEFTAIDSIMGIDIRQLTCGIGYNKEQLHLRDVVVQQKNTKLHFDEGFLTLPSKKLGRRLAYRTSLIKGSPVLKDISRTFAPVLQNFTMPLLLQVRMSGDDNGMEFRDIKVGTSDKMLDIAATGYINNLKDKYALQVHFDVQHMRAKGGIKEKIIKQFPVKRFMMKQLHRLGTLHYVGSFDVLWKKEQFRGNLNTAGGKLKFFFQLDETNKYLTGTASTEHLELGQVMDMPDIGPVAAEASFQVDISKPRTAVMRRKYGGKLPICSVKAHVSKGSYKFIKTSNLTAEIVSNGAVAEGTIDAPGKRIDLGCTFSFTNTNEMKKTKIKPRMKIHKMSDEDKAARKAEKEARKAEKAKEKAAKKAEKERKKAEEEAAGADKPKKKKKWLFF